jgi:porin
MRTLLVAACALRATSVAADPPPGEYPEHRFRSPFPASTARVAQDFEDKYLLGDWGGARSQLASWGIELELLAITDPFGNVVEGKKRGVADYNLVAADLKLELDPLVGFHGGELHVGFAALFGRSLSASYVGNSFPIQLADVADQHVRLTYLSFTQSFAEDEVSIRLGRLTINSVFGEEFLASEYFKAFTSVGIDLVPLGLFLNAPGAFGYPDATWGVRAKVEPVSWFYVMGGAYNGDPALKQGERHGVDFSLRGPLFLIGELGVRRNYGKQSSRLASNLKLGANYDGGRYGVYAIGDQELVRFGEASAGRHVGAFGALTIAPGDGAPVPVFVDCGLVLYGPTSGRAKDFVGLAVVYGAYRNPRDFEMTLEATYGLKPVPGLVLQPDVQYIIHPSGDPSIANALAVGMNVIVTP